MNVLLIFFIGVSAGSFAGCMSNRLIAEQKLFAVRSVCDHCSKILNWISLIPILGWLINRGKCSFCGNKVTYYYPLLEFMTGIVMVMLYLRGGITILYVLQIIFITLFLINALTDMMKLVVYDRISWFALGVAGMIFLLEQGLDIYRMLVIGLVMVVFLGIDLLVSKLVNKKAMGEGDYFALLAILLVLYDVFVKVLLIACLVGIIYGLIKRNRIIPFYPLLFIGTVIGMIFW